MRKLVYHVGTSLDNYISREDGSVEGFLWEGDHVDDYVFSKTLGSRLEPAG